QGGPVCAVQHQNKALVFTTPNLHFADYHRAMPETITSIQSTIALANYQPTPTWKLYVDGKPVPMTLPIRAKQRSRITIHDGVTYLGLIPIPATNLGRSEEILITDGGAPVDLQGGGKAAPTLLVNSYYYFNPNQPFDPKTADWTKTDRAYGGFVIEMGDEAEYGSFQNFQKHVASAKLTLKWDEAAGVLHTVYQSGKDTIEAGFRPEYDGAWSKNVPSIACFPYRRVNGQWPYLAPGVERETTLSIQGTAGTLAKNGAVLRHQPGLMAYLLTEPISGTYLFSNPLPDPQYLEITVPGGMTITADGRLALAQCTANTAASTLDVRYAAKEGQVGDDMAAALVLTGCATAPKVTVNDKAITPVEMTCDGAPALVVPLTAAKITEAFAARYAASRAVQAAALTTTVAAQAWLRYKAKQEHYVLTEPRSGAFSFWRQWPGNCAIEAGIPGGMVVATDGDIALQRLILSARDVLAVVG
ncbi:MAG TPA: hypothetical protein PK794_14005, partial [Armatimonadota bacterium]|nr:hypothetical protein [Armatimonadota bacterium]